MPDYPPSVLAAGIDAMNEAYARRGWNKPEPWWVSEIVTGILDAAAPLLAEAGEREPSRAKPYRSAVRSVPCPYCGAAAGEMCRTPTVSAARYHAARKRALAAAEAPPVPPEGKD